MYDFSFSIVRKVKYSRNWIQYFEKNYESIASGYSEKINVKNLY